MARIGLPYLTGVKVTGEEKDDVGIARGRLIIDAPLYNCTFTSFPLLLVHAQGGGRSAGNAIQSGTPSPTLAPASGCLLVGPPGCGKTLVWRTLVAALCGAQALADPSVVVRLYPEV